MKLYLDIKNETFKLEKFRIYHLEFNNYFYSTIIYNNDNFEFNLSDILADTNAANNTVEESITTGKTIRENIMLSMLERFQ